METIEEKAREYGRIIESDAYDANRNEAQKLVDGLRVKQAYKEGYIRAIVDAIETIQRHKEKPQIAIASLMDLIGKNYFK